MRIYLKNTSGGLIPCTDSDAELKRSLKIGQVYQCELKESRNYAFLRKFFALIECTWDCITDEQREYFITPEGLRKTLQLAAGHCERVYSLADREYQDIPLSISFSSMKEHDFQKLYDRIKQVIFGYVLKGRITEDQFEEHLQNF